MPGGRHGGLDLQPRLRRRGRPTNQMRAGFPRLESLPSPKCAWEFMAAPVPIKLLLLITSSPRFDLEKLDSILRALLCFLETMRIGLVGIVVAPSSGNAIPRLLLVASIRQLEANSIAKHKIVEKC